MPLPAASSYLHQQGSSLSSSIDCNCGREVMSQANFKPVKPSEVKINTLSLTANKASISDHRIPMLYSTITICHVRGKTVTR